MRPAPLTVGIAGNGTGALVLFPPLGLGSTGFTSLGLGISFGGIAVPGVTGTAPAGRGLAHPPTVVAPHGSQLGPWCFLQPHRDFSLSNRLGRLATLVGQELHGAGAQTGAGAQAGAHPQSCDFLPNLDFSRSRRLGLQPPQSEV